MRQIIEEQILPRVTKPSRYLGNEWNAVHKNWEGIKVRMAFAFPDVYEVAMSHLGLQILYGLVNREKDFLMERVFAPWQDMEELLRKIQLPLFSLESYRPVSDFDILGFTLQYEMSFSNILNMLELSGVPFRTADRDDGHPLIIAGGPAALNPEPLADFFDCFLLGDAEELLPELLRKVLEMKGNPDQRIDKKKLKENIAKIDGVYLPEYYRVSYHNAGTIAHIGPTVDFVPHKVVRRVVKDLENAYFPTAPIVPYMDVVHERAMLEVLRGCTRGCRFCQAGMTYRPVRERSPKTLCSQAEELVKNTGYDEISLTSLSTADYTCVEPVLRTLIAAHGGQKVGISLPSLRVDAFSVKLAEEIQKVRKSTLTFAPEAGSQRLRDVINKGVTEKDLEETAKGAFAAGWTALKLYFMLGLPSETKEDLEGIARLVKKVREIGMRTAAEQKMPKHKIKVTVSVSSFVPKAHTPFQWEPQNDIAELKEKQKYLKGLLSGRGIVYNYHDAELSFLEAVFAKGDRRLGAVLERAHQLGCKFDSWNEFFDFRKWQEAFEQCGVDPHFYANRRINYEEILPWDHLDTGVKKRFLQVENVRALKEKTTADCRGKECAGGCGICHRFDVEMILSGEHN